ncbi:hypothetical protein K7H22_12495 [Seohaeicola saemankumensis]|uniref:hypothetical protein n=1 Tax=Seohaeicola saemankumensis TaxID=481181 RepID=UPI001E4FFA56|nr:hypothetical protein [Seohaeicola saemankumensis]MCD1626813.1 hypothetical protein [Seohaeicola saemankumensis]
MLDATPITLTKTEAWQEHISYGDVVSFRFPVAEAGDDAPLKARPCLILDIEEKKGVRYALLAYGTTSRRKANTGYEIHVRTSFACAAVGLDAPTRFVGARRILVPLSHSGFVIHPGLGAPVLGRLEGDEFERMNEVRARIFAMADIRAERKVWTLRKRTRKFLNTYTVEPRRLSRARPAPQELRQLDLPLPTVAQPKRR